MSNFKSIQCKKRNYDPDIYKTCDSTPIKRRTQPSETWTSFLSNLSADFESSIVDENVKLELTKNKLKTVESLQTSVLSDFITNIPQEKITENSNYSSSCTDSEIFNNESQSMSRSIKDEDAIKSLSNNEESMPSESWSEFLNNVSQSVIKENSPKISDKIIKTEKSKQLNMNDQSTSLGIKLENDTNNLYPITSLKLEKHMKTEFWSDFLSKTSQNVDLYANISNEDNRKLCLKIENDIYKVNHKFLSQNHKTSTPVKKKHLSVGKKRNFISSDVSSSSLCASHRDFRQTEKTGLKTFKGEMAMRNHMKIVHLDDGFPWKCSDCGEKFSVFLEFISHKKVRHSKDVKNWTCYICGALDDPVFHCHYCKYSSTSMSLFQAHLNGHKGNRSLIRCHYCEKAFERRTAMADHMRSFHRDEKLECQICGMKSTNLPQHISLVHAGAPKTCAVCGQQFKYKRDLLLHERKIHDARPLATCDICGASLPDYYYRKKHMLAHDKHVDENGQYLALPESEMKKLDGIIKRRMNHPSRFVSTLCGLDQPGGCSHFATDVARQQANVLCNSKMIDTFDLKFFLVQTDK